MKTITRKQISAAQRAIYKQKRLADKKVNKKDQEKTPKSWFGRLIQDWILSFEKRQRNK